MQDDLSHFVTAKRKMENVICGYLMLLKNGNYLLRGSLYNDSEAFEVSVKYPSTSIPLLENIYSEFIVEWQQKKGKGKNIRNLQNLRNFDVIIINWIKKKRPDFPLPFSYQEFGDMIWESLRVDFSIWRGGDINLIQDKLITRISEN